VLDEPNPTVGQGIDAARPREVREVAQVLVPQRFLPANRLVDEDPEALRRRFQDENNVQSLLPLRSVEGYGVYGTFELNVINGPKVGDIEDFEFRLSYIYKDPVNVTSEADFIARTETLVCPAAKRMDRGTLPLPGTLPSNNILTGILCHRNAKVEYQQAKVGDGRDVTCGPTIASFDLTEEAEADLFRSLGQLTCLTINPTGDPQKDKPALVADIEGLAGKNENASCRRSELLLLTAFGAAPATGAQINCFGDRK
jgi:hypothetical protein